MIDKEFLVKKSHYNKLLTNFNPRIFNSLKTYDLNITNENKIKPTANLSREFENIISTDKTPMFTFSLEKLTELYKNENYDTCFELLRVSLENVLNYFSKAKIPAKEKIEFIYSKGLINYGTMNYCLKVMEILNDRIIQYRIKKDMDIVSPYCEIYYRRAERIEIEDRKEILI
jgi:hypothetical protein